MRTAEWELGGPRRFAQSIADDLDSGHSVIVTLPLRGVPEGLYSAVRAGLPQIAVNHLSLSNLVGERHRVVDRLLETLDLDTNQFADERVHVGHFTGHEQLGRRLLWVDCQGASSDEIRAWASFIKQYVAAASEVPWHRRAVLATVCHGTHGSLMPVSDGLLISRWWWGVVGRLDTATHVADLLSARQCLPAFAETITEIASFDLSVAALLAAEWDGAVENLIALLAEYDSAGAGSEFGFSPDPAPGPQPPPDSVSAWSLGLLNAWSDDDPRLHSCNHCAEPERIHNLIWRAQVGALMPIFEIERQALAQWVHARRDQVAQQWEKFDLLGAEPGHLAAIFNESPKLQRDRNRARRAQWLRRVRNQIAHVEILELSDLEIARQLKAPRF